MNKDEIKDVLNETVPVRIGTVVGSVLIAGVMVVVSVVSNRKSYYNGFRTGVNTIIAAALRK